MATHGKLTVGKLKYFLNAFHDDTPVVMGLSELYVVECQANSYYPPDDHENWPYVIIDVLTESVEQPK